MADLPGTDLIAAARRFVVSPGYRDLTLRQLAVLGIVTDEVGPHKLRHLADALGVSKPVITRATRKLAALDLLVRRRPGEDRRDCLIAATDAGRALRAAFVTEAL